MRYLPLPLSTMKALSELKVSAYSLGRRLTDNEHSVNALATNALRELAEYNYDEAIKIVELLKEFNVVFDFSKHKNNILSAKRRYEKI